VGDQFVFARLPAVLPAGIAETEGAIEIAGRHKIEGCISMKDLKVLYSVPARKKIRVIINTDAKNEADDQYAIVHALLTPKFDIKGFIGAHFGDEKSKTSMLDSCREIEKLFNLMQLHDRHDLIFHGSANKISDRNALPESAGSDFIIAEAFRNESQPLFIIFLGPLTDLAIALMKEPRIKDRFTALWIGGGAWPSGGWEYNLLNDIEAANIVFQSGINLWQVPRNVYSKVRVSLAELQVKARPMGNIGKYLFEQMMEVNNKYADNTSWPLGESWSLGDSAAIGLLMDDQEFSYTEKNAPTFDDEMRYVHHDNSTKIRVYDDIDARFIIEDFFAKLMIYSQTT
jgi:purine nucleosidase